MRFGVVGLGSMGRRRVRDLLALGHEVAGFDVRVERSAERIDRVSALDRLFAQSLDGLVISTPPDEHAALYDRAIAEGVPFFSEANVLTPHPEGLEGHGHPSATWRFYAPFAALRRELAGRDVLTVHHAYGGWLPGWHPWESYDAFYAGRRREICAAREMVPFELEWLVWVFGEVESVGATHGARGVWATDIDDTYVLDLGFTSGVTGTLIVELHQRAPFRLARISCPAAGYAVDVAAHELRRFDPDHGWSVLERGPADFESVYRDEIAAFAAAVAGEAPYPKTWHEDRHLSDVLVAAEESRRRGARVEVAEVATQYDGRLLGAEAVHA
jgi:predicted dehydrogenase